MMRSGTLLIVVIIVSTFGNVQNAAAQKKPKVDVVAFSPDGKIQAKGIGKGISISDVATKKIILRLMAHKSRITALEFSPDGKRLASAGFKDKFINLWHMPSGRVLFRIQAPVGIEDLLYSGDGATITAVDSKQTMHVFDAKTGKLIRVVQQK